MFEGSVITGRWDHSGPTGVAYGTRATPTNIEPDLWHDQDFLGIWRTVDSPRFKRKFKSTRASLEMCREIFETVLRKAERDGSSAVPLLKKALADLNKQITHIDRNGNAVP